MYRMGSSADGEMCNRGLFHFECALRFDRLYKPQKRSIMKRIFSHLTFFLAVPLAIGMSISNRCEADWVNNSSGGMPFDAIVGGDNSEDPTTLAKVFYVCRAYHNNDVQPGYAFANDSVCHFGYGGLELTSANFDWYVPSWSYSYGQAMPSNTIVLGADPENGTPTYRYPCRVNFHSR
jgi:Protein of unknown function (DUF3421)